MTAISQLDGPLQFLFAPDKKNVLNCSLVILLLKKCASQITLNIFNDRK